MLTNPDESEKQKKQFAIGEKAGDTDTGKVSPSQKPRLFKSQTGKGLTIGWESIEKIIPLTLIGLCVFLIILRVTRVMPGILATDEFEISRTIFIDAGIGGLLAVFAIVISLTLMGIQFASQEYTHRVMNTYLHSVMLWSMMVVYMATLLYNLYMTAFMKSPVNPIYADISVIAQSLCLIMLIPHFIIAVIHLKPDFTIDRLLNSINTAYLNSIKDRLNSENDRLPAEFDRLLPAVEIIEKCIERGDRATVRVGLNNLFASYRRNVNPVNEEWAGKYYLDYFLRLGREAVIEADDDSIVQVLEILGKICQISSSPTIIGIAVRNVRTIGSNALKKEYEAGVEQMIDSLHKVVSTTDNSEITERIFDSYEEIATKLFSQDKKQLILYFLTRLTELVEIMVENNQTRKLERWIAIVENIGQQAVKQEIREVIHPVIRSFYEAGILTAKKNLDISHSIIESLVRIEHKIARTDRELYGEINFAKQEIERQVKKHTEKEQAPPGIETSDLW